MGAEALHLGMLLPGTVGLCCAFYGGGGRRRPPAATVSAVAAAALMLAAMLDMALGFVVLSPVWWCAALLTAAVVDAGICRRSLRSQTRPGMALHRSAGLLLCATLLLPVGGRPIDTAGGLAGSTAAGHAHSLLSGSGLSPLSLVLVLAVVAYLVTGVVGLAHRGDRRSATGHRVTVVDRVAMTVAVASMAAMALL